MTTADQARLSEERLVGAADLVVEVVSDHSKHRDRVATFAECAAAGVREYWVGDPRPGRDALAGFALGPHGYEPILPDPDGRMPSRLLPGIRFDPAWFWGTRS